MNTMLLQFLMGIGLLQSVILGYILVLYPGTNRYVSKLTGIALILAGILIASELAEQFSLEESLGILMEFSILIDLLLVSLMWIVSQFITGLKKKFLVNDLLHLLPFAGGLFIYIALLHRFGLESPGTFSTIPDTVGIFLGSKNVVWICYMLLILKVYFSKNYPQSQWSFRVTRRMLNSILLPYIVVCFISYFAFWVMFFGGRLPLNLDSDYLSILMVVGFVYYLTFTILREPQLFISVSNSRYFPKYGSSKIEYTKSKVYRKQLLELLEVEKPYLDDKLSLLDLAHKLDLPANTVSQLINEHFGKNFHELINAYRLKEVKLKLLDHTEDHKTLLALAFEAGFQSKASFNRVFKKNEGMTPSEYKTRYRSQPTF